jgi:hypothetical protein
MWRTLFLSIMHKLSEIFLYFSERYDATGPAGLTTLQKCTVAIRQLAYGMVVDMIDEYLKLRKSTALGHHGVFWDEFLHHPAIANTQRLLAKTEEDGFLGMLGSINCMH